MSEMDTIKQNPSSDTIKQNPSSDTIKQNPSSDTIKQNPSSKREGTTTISFPYVFEQRIQIGDKHRKEVREALHNFCEFSFIQQLHKKQSLDKLSLPLKEDYFALMRERAPAAVSKNADAIVSGYCCLMLGYVYYHFMGRTAEFPLEDTIDVILMYLMIDYTVDDSSLEPATKEYLMRQMGTLLGQPPPPPEETDEKGTDKQNSRAGEINQMMGSCAGEIDEIVSSLARIQKHFKSKFPSVFDDLTQKSYVCLKETLKVQNPLRKAQRNAEESQKHQDDEMGKTTKLAEGKDTTTKLAEGKGSTKLAERKVSSIRESVREVTVTKAKLFYDMAAMIYDGDPHRNAACEPFVPGFIQMMDDIVDCEQDEKEGIETLVTLQLKECGNVDGILANMLQACFQIPRYGRMFLLFGLASAIWLSAARGHLTECGQIELLGSALSKDETDHFMSIFAQKAAFREKFLGVFFAQTEIISPSRTAECFDFFGKYANLC